MGRPDMAYNPNTKAPHTHGDYWFNGAIDGTGPFVNVPSCPGGTSAYVLGQCPNAYRPGNEKVGSVRMPGYQDYRISLAKNLQLKEQQRLQVRFEAFNPFNIVNPQAVVMGFGNANFGRVNSWLPMRQVQLGARYMF